MRFRIDALTQELKRVEREKAALRNDLEDSQQAVRSVDMVIRRRP